MAWQAGLLMHNNKGQSLIEILVVIAIMAIILPAIISGFVVSREARPQQQRRLRAAEIMKETQEAVRIIRENGWSNISDDDTYYPEPAGNSWTLTQGSEIVDGITRQIIISSVYRDSNNTIVSPETPGAILDPSTKSVTIRLNWTEPIPSTVESSFYLARYLDNATYTQTTKAQFDTGIPFSANVITTDTSGGEVTLAPNVKGKWCEPQLAPVTIDLPGLPRAISAVEGHIYAATGQSAGGGVDSFAHVLVTNTDPPSFSLHGKFQDYETNDVFGEPNWGYIATTNNSKEVVIIDLNQYSDIPNKIYKERGYFNTPSDTTDADTVFVLGNQGYVTAGRYLYVFNLSTINDPYTSPASFPQIGSRIQFADSGDSENKAGEIYIRQVGGSTYVYISVVGSHTDELEIANVTSYPGQWTILTRSGSNLSDNKLNIEPNNCSTLESGKAIFVNVAGDRAYISSINDASFKEFFVINTSNKSNPSLVGGFATNPPCTNGGGYEAGGMDPEQSVVVKSTVDNDRVILVGTDAPGGANSEEYQVLKLNDGGSEATPVRCGGLQYDVGIYGVAAVKETDGDAYAYLITGDNLNELKVVQGGPDGNYVESGIYESATFDEIGYSTAFNRFLPTFVKPAQTIINFQIAIADPIGGSCNGVTFTFTGPDGTNGTYYDVENPIALNDDGAAYENPARCMRYRAYLSTSNYNTTPVLEAVTINYSL